MRFADGQIAVWTAIGAVIGGAAVSLFDISVDDKLEKLNRCVTYKVSNQTMTSYVLKPPPATQAACPAPQVQKEEPFKKAVYVPDEPEETVVEKEISKPQRHHRRHYRVRRYWR